MFDRPEEQQPRNSGRVNHDAENTSSSKASTKYIYIIIGIFVLCGLIGGGFFLYDLGKSSSSKPYSKPNSEIILSEPTQTTSSEERNTEEISFQELIGEYTGNIKNEVVTVKIFAEGEKKRYSYSKNNRLSYMLFHFPKTNEINFHRPKEGLAEFKAIKEGNSIVLRSPNVELRKINN
ncbi:hypothetical protein [Bernardetia sp.]|uniref:hypothetical protein n=1 Tax=Bernardetia sp. TaxID=1937974 RepID=UPI0025B8CB8E|nr:hypothetical protein [Bernardetia sp.]